MRNHTTRPNDPPLGLIHPRLLFQWLASTGIVLNIGCESDPARFGEHGHRNVDVDDWSGTVPNFTQCDARELPFPDRAFDTCVLGDMLEHTPEPEKVVAEAARVARKRVVITLPFEDPHPEERVETHVEELRKLGLKSLAPGDIALRHSHLEKIEYADACEYARMLRRTGLTVDGPHPLHARDWSGWTIVGDRVARPSLLKRVCALFAWWW